jgi:LPS export ABC transporter protein LptC
MSRTRQSFLILFIGVITLVYGYWQLKACHPKTRYAIAKPSFDSLISNVHWIEFNERGEISQEFFSPEIRGYANENFYDIITPLFKLTREQELWEIQSNFAKAYHHSDKIDLNENVLIKHMSPNSKTPAILKTQQIQYLVKEQKAQTKHHVILEQGNNIIHSDGMIASFKEHETLHLGNVLGSYQPKEPPKS